MNLTPCKDTSLTYPNGECRLASHVPINEESYLFRIEGNQVLDQYMVESNDAEYKGERL